MPRRSARKAAKPDSKPEPDPEPPEPTLGANDNVVMMVLPPNIAEELAKSGGQLTPELLTAIAQSQESFKPVPLQIEPTSSEKEESLGSTTSIKVTNSTPPSSDAVDASPRSLRRSRARSGTNESEPSDLPVITSSLPSDSENSSPKRVTRSSPKKANDIDTPMNKTPASTPTPARKRGRPPKKKLIVTTPNSVQENKDNIAAKGSKNDKTQESEENVDKGSEKPAVITPAPRGRGRPRKNTSSNVVNSTPKHNSATVDSSSSLKGEQTTSHQLKGHSPSTVNNKIQLSDVENVSAPTSTSVQSVSSPVENVIKENQRSVDNSNEKTENEVNVIPKSNEVNVIPKSNEVNIIPKSNEVIKAANQGNLAEDLKNSPSLKADTCENAKPVIQANTSSSVPSEYVTNTTNMIRTSPLNDGASTSVQNFSFKPINSNLPKSSPSHLNTPTDLKKGDGSSSSNIPKVQCSIEFVNPTIKDFPTPNLVDDVKDDTLGMTQEDLKQLDAVLSTDQAKAILDTIPIEELLDQPIDQSEEAMLDGLKNFPGDKDVDLLDVLDVGSGVKPCETENLQYLSNLVLMDHSYFLDPNQPAETKSEDKSELDDASSDSILSKRAGSPIRRSQRQQDKVLKEQAEKIRAENVAAHKRELEEMAKLKNLEADKAPEDKAEIHKTTPIIAVETTCSDNKTEAVMEKVEEIKDKTHLTKEKLDVKLILKNKEDVDKSNVKVDKDSKTVKGKDLKADLEKTRKKEKPIDKAKGVVKSRKSTGRRHSDGSDLAKIKRKQKPSLDDLHTSKNDIKEDKEVNCKNTCNTGERARALSLTETFESSPAAEKNILKKEKKLIKKSPAISYLSLEPALFSQPDVFVTKTKDEEAKSAEVEPTSPQFRNTEVKKHTLNKDALSRKEKESSASTSDLQLQKINCKELHGASKAEKELNKKHEIKGADGDLKPGIKKVLNSESSNSGVVNKTKNRADSKPKAEVDSMKAESKHSSKSESSRRKSHDQPETLNDIIAELSSSTESPEKGNKSLKHVKHKKNEKSAKDLDEAVAFKDVNEENDSVRKSYPKRENRRLPAHFKLFEQELLPLKPEKTEKEEMEEMKVKTPIKSNSSDSPKVKSNNDSLKFPKTTKDSEHKKEKISVTLDNVSGLLDEDASEGEASDDSWCSEDDPERLWCICKSPHNNRFMICCDKCEEWFHGSCVGISKKDGNLLTDQGKSWFCPVCVKDKESKLAIKELPDKAVPKSVKSEKEDTTDSKIKLNHKEMKKVFEKVQIKPGKPSSEQPGNSKEKRTEHPGTSPNVKIFKPRSYKRFKTNKPSNLCITTGCQNLCRPKSNFCSDECIKIYSNDSIRFFKTLRDSKKVPDANVTLNSHAIPVIDTQTRKLVLSKDFPTETTLCKWLVDNPACEVVQLVHNDSSSKTKEHVRKPSISESSVRPSKAVSDQKIRNGVSKMLFDALDARLKDATDMKMSTEEVKKISDSIEKELYHYHKDLGMKYKSKCRSLVFNIKDPKNHGLFRKVLKSRIKPHKLVRMTSEEMASKELAEWRERENKHSLEIIKKDEEDRMKKVLKQQKLEKIEIFDEKTADIDVTVDTSKILKEAEKLAQLEAAKDPSHQKGSQQESKKSSEHSSDHSSKKKSKKSSRERHHSSSSKSKSSSSHSHDKTKSHSKSSSNSSHSKSKSSSSSSHSKSSSSSKSSSLSNSKHSSSSSKDKSSKSSESNCKSQTEISSESSKAPVVENKLPEVEQKSTVESQLYQKPKSIWKGSICMPDVTNFVASAALIHGPKGSFGEEPPNSIQVCGRIYAADVFKYLEEVKSSPTREVVVLRFDPATDDEKIAYISFYEYLNARQRFGVVDNFSNQLKDFYLMPLACNKLVPDVLRTLEGPGLSENHPHLLIGILVVKAYKRVGEAIDNSVVPVKLPKLTQNENPSFQTTEDSGRSYTPPLTGKFVANENSTTPPLNQDDEPSFTPPLNNDDDIPYSPTHETVIEDDGDKPYDPEESVNDLQKLKDLQDKLERNENISELTSQDVTDINTTLGYDPCSSGGLNSTSKCDQQNHILIELTKRVEHETSVLTKRIVMANGNKLSNSLKMEESVQASVAASIAASTDSISLPPNLAEILQSLQNKPHNFSENELLEDGSNNSSTQNVMEDPIVKNFAHYSPTDDYDLKDSKGSTPPGTPPLSYADDEPKTPPMKMPRYEDPVTPPSIHSDPRLLAKSNDRGSNSKVSRKDPRQKSSSSLKNMTESELLERARKQLEEMDKDSSNPTINTEIQPPNMPPPLPPPQMYPPNFPPPILLPPPPPVPVAPFPPQFDRPPPPVPDMTWNQPVEAMSNMYPSNNLDNVTAAVLDFAKSDHPPAAWEHAPQMIQKRRKKSRRQHEHWRGLRQRWQNEQRYEVNDHPPVSFRDEDNNHPQPGGSHPQQDLEEGECPDQQVKRNYSDRQDGSFSHRDNFRGRGFHRGRNQHKNRGNFQFRNQRGRGQSFRNPDSSTS